MIYFFLVLSLGVNGVLVWYSRKLLQRYANDIEVREDFIRMISDYADSLQGIYKLEELYGEEILKKAITQTRFVQEACQEFKTYLQTEEIQEEGDGEEDGEEDSEEGDKKKDIIRLREGESVTQDAASYKKVIPDRTV